MKKEVIIAILIGFGIGLLITVGIHATRKKDTGVLNPVADITPTIAPNNEHHVEIISPLENSLQSSPNLLIKGQTTPDSSIILQTEQTYQIKIADSSGAFEADFPLSFGPNQITLTSYDPTGASATFVLETTYLPLDEEEASEEEASDES